MISQDTLGCKPTWVGVSDGNGTRRPTKLKGPAEGLLRSWLEAGAQTPSSGRRVLCLSWNLLCVGFALGRPVPLWPVAAPSSFCSSVSLPPVKRASLSHKSSRCDFASVGLSPVNLPQSVTGAREMAVAVLSAHRWS